MSHTHLYVMAAMRDDGPGAPVKVGISNAPEKRLATINTASPFRVSLFRTFRLPNRNVAATLERMFHDVKKEHRLNGEWFQMEPTEAITGLSFAFAFAYIEIMQRPRHRIQEWFEFIGMPEAVFVDGDQTCWGCGMAGELRGS